MSLGRSMAFWLCLLGASCIAQIITTQQIPLSSFPVSRTAWVPVGSSNFTTLSLNALSTNEFTTLAHPSYPRHSVRIKKAPADFCDPSVNKYTGYIDVSGARHLFFYFFESRRDPKKDDVMLWLNGGPGATHATGLYFELGPCSVVNATDTKVNPYSWNEHTSIFFMDQPVGVGFSYAEYGEKVDSTEEGAKDMAAFLAIFFETFTDFKGLPFHMAGESYAGRYLPVYASEVYEQNKKLVDEGRDPINLTSVMIGNGWTSLYHMTPSFYDAVCTPKLVEPVMDIATCIRMKTVRPRCEKMLKDSCYDMFDSISCGAAFTFCAYELMLPTEALGLNVYDLTKPCADYNESLCYAELNDVKKYLNNPDVRKMLGVDSRIANNTNTIMTYEVLFQFWSRLDMLQVRTEYYLENLLDRGINVLLYVGAYDWIANWIGVENMVDTLEWHGSGEFKKQEWAALKGKDQSKARYGRYKSAGGLSFVTVDAAGHMVPHDKLAESLEMVDHWIKHLSF